MVVVMMALPQMESDGAVRVQTKHEFLGAGLVAGQDLLRTLGDASRERKGADNDARHREWVMSMLKKR